MMNTTIPTNVQPQPSTTMEMNPMKESSQHDSNHNLSQHNPPTSSHQECEYHNESASEDIVQAQRLRGGCQACCMGMLGCFFCCECCKECLECIVDVICCPCETCCKCCC